MKFSFVRATVALAAVAALASCGGKAEFTVQGNFTDSTLTTLIPLANSGLILANGSDTVTVSQGATSFTFPTQISYGSDYNITVRQQPAHMTCAVANGSGSAGHNVAIKASIVCSQNSYALGGQFTGLTVAADGTTARTVTLLNGSTDTLTISSASGTNGAGSFAFSSAVKDGQAYGVTVVDPGNGLSCTIANGTGVMHDVPVNNLLLTCVPK